MEKKRYIKPECSINEFNSENIMLNTSTDTPTGSAGQLSNKWRNPERNINNWDNIWSN